MPLSAPTKYRQNITKNPIAGAIRYRLRWQCREWSRRPCEMVHIRRSPM